MSICTICRGSHHAASCKNKPLRRASEQPVPQFVPLTTDQLDDLSYRAKENRQFRRTELEQLIATARKWNEVAVAAHAPGQWVQVDSFARLQDEMRRRLA